MASFFSMPFLAIFLAKKTTLTPVAIGGIIALSPLAGVVGAFLGGSLSDRIGRKNILSTSLFIMSLLFFGFYIVANIDNLEIQVPLFAFLNLLTGFCAWIFQPVSQALITDLLVHELRAKAFHLRYLALNIGAAFGPILGARMGISAEPIGFLVTGICYAVYSITIFTVLRKNYSSKETPGHMKKISWSDIWQALLKDSRLRYFILGGIAFMACYSQLESNLSQYLIRNFSDGVQMFANLLSLNGLIIVIAHMPVYLFIRRIKSTSSLLCGTIIFSAGFLILACTNPGSEHGKMLIVLAMIVISLGEILVFPVSINCIEQIAPDHLRGTYFGAAVLRQLGLFIGPPLGGLFLNHGNGQMLFIGVALAALISGFLYMKGGQVQNQTKEEMPCLKSA